MTEQNYTHKFCVEDARKYGVHEAILLFNLRFWINANKKAGKNVHDGRHWTFNSVSSFREIFPYWTEQQIKTIIKNLKRDGAIITGCFNKKRYDRTSWYTTTDELSLVSSKCNSSMEQESLVDKVNTPNASAENTRPIPDRKPDSNLTSNPISRYRGRDGEVNMNKVYEQETKVQVSTSSFPDYSDLTIDQIESYSMQVRITDSDVEPSLYSQKRYIA